MSRWPTPNRRRRRDAPDGRVRLRGDDHQVAEAGGRADRGRRAAARDLDRQGRHRGAEPRRPASSQQILVQEGETVEVGTKLAVIGAPERRTARRHSLRRRRSAPEPATTEAAARGRRRLERRDPGADTRAGRGRPAPGRSCAPHGAAAEAEHERQEFVSPVVARIASEHGVDASPGQGTGRGGRVTKKDILALHRVGRAGRRADGAGCSGRAAPAPAPPAAPPPPSPRRRPLLRRHRRLLAAAPAAPPRKPAPGESFEPMTAMRKGIAEHMRRSLDTSAHVTSAIEVDMSKVVAIREKLKPEYQKSYGVNPTYLIFVARAVGRDAQGLPVDQRRDPRRPDRHAQLRQPRLRRRARRTARD